MTRLAIVVEGETEEEFVKQVLAKYLFGCGVIPHAVMPRRRGITSGGARPVNQLASQMYKLCWNFDFVTSLFDLYGFPGRQSCESVEDLERWIDDEVDKLFGDDWDRSRVFAYVQKYEFEGLLFLRRSSLHTGPRRFSELHTVAGEYPRMLPNAGGH